jgi:signal transduction histidine kinase
MWPWQHSLQYRILIAYGAVFFSTLVLLMMWLSSAIYRADLQAGAGELEVTALLVANALEDPSSGYIGEFAESDYEEAAAKGGLEDRSPIGAGAEVTRSPQYFPRLQVVADRYADEAQARVAIFGANGRVLAVTGEQRSLASADEWERSEIRMARTGVVGYDMRADPQTLAPTVYVAAPIRQDDVLLGIVCASKTVDAITADARAVLLRLALVSLLALGVATVLAIWIGQRLVQPLRKLEEAAFAVADGDLSQTVVVQSNDEVGALARAFNFMVAEVRSTLDQQRHFIANASHELRTPLTNIKLRSEALRMLGPADAELQQRYVVEIEAEADRLSLLADDLLELARLEETVRRAPPEATDVVPILHEVTEVMRLRAEKAGLALRSAIDSNLPRLMVNVEDITTVAVNLLDNAVKYTPPGGAVQLIASAGSGEVEIRIEDSGPGIPSEDLPHIFDRFYRVDKARGRSRDSDGHGSSGGAGLGLAIVRKLVEQNQGRIRVEPAPVQGTVFVVSFPAVA